MTRSSLRIFALLAMVFAAGACAGPRHAEDVEPVSSEQVDLMPADGAEALEWLQAGNHRFVTGHPRHDHESMRRIAMLSEGQHPFATVLACSDSRVSPELVLDHGLGDLFMIRVAGNVVAEDEAGSIEYAVAHLDTPLILVLGHEGCGAVTAALGEFGDEPAELVALLEHITPALADLPAELSASERVHRGVEANVRQSVAQLRAMVQRVNGPGATTPLVVGAVYGLEDGRVRVLDG
jgi:carbonic anhydrase